MTTPLTAEAPSETSPAPTQDEVKKTPPAPSTATQKAESQPRSGKLSLALAVLAVGLSAGAFVWPYLASQNPTSSANAPSLSTATLSPDQEKRLSVLEQSLDHALQQINGLDGQIKAIPADPTAPLRAQIDTLDEKLAAVTTLAESLKADMAKAASADLASKSYLVAALQLVTAWQQGSNFAAPWAMVQQAGDRLGVPLLADLSDNASVLLPYQESGIPSLASLIRQFTPLASDLASLSVNSDAATDGAEKPQSPSFWSQTKQRLSSLVVIRRQGELIGATPDSPQALVARAQSQMETGNLGAALETLAPLEEQMNDTAHAWLQAARARITADELSLALAQSAGQLLSQQEKGP